MQNFVHLQRPDRHSHRWMKQSIERWSHLAWTRWAQQPTQSRLMADRICRRLSAMHEPWPCFDHRRPCWRRPKYSPACDCPVNLGSTRCRIGIATVSSVCNSVVIDVYCCCFFLCQTTYDIFRIQIYWMRPVICVCPRECVHLIFPNHSAYFHRNIRIHSKTFHFFYFIRIDHGHCCLRTFECIFQPFICRMLYSIRCTVRDMWIFCVCWFAAFILRSIVLHGMCCGQTPADGSMDWTFIIRSANWRCWYVLGVRLLVQHI